MFNPQLTQTVEHFASVMHPLSEETLGKEWVWKDHDAVIGISTKDADKVLAEGEWPERRAYAHILGVDIGATKMDDTAILTTASSITERTKEIESLLGSN